MNKKKIYIAGKITGNSNYQKEFAEAQKQIESQGNIVLNPASLPQGMNKADYMRICFAMIDIADVVAFIEGFDESPGAMLELDYCRYIEKPAFMVFRKEK